MCPRMCFLCAVVNPGYGATMVPPWIMIKRTQKAVARIPERRCGSWRLGNPPNSWSSVVNYKLDGWAEILKRGGRGGRGRGDDCGAKSGPQSFRPTQVSPPPPTYIPRPWLFRTRHCCIAWVGLKHIILLPQPHQAGSHMMHLFLVRMYLFSAT